MRHGVPEIVVSDNGPQYASEHFKHFAQDYSFTSITSSPHYPQENGEVERAVQTVKNLLKKSTDPYKALMSYRNTPIHNGYSPAELLMSRRLRTDLPVEPSTLKPKLTDHEQLSDIEHSYKQRMKDDHDSRHNARELPVIPVNSDVYIRDTGKSGTVTQTHPCRSYSINTGYGIVKRNRRAISPLTADNENSTKQSNIDNPCNTPVIEIDTPVSNT